MDLQLRDPKFLFFGLFPLGAAVALATGATPLPVQPESVAGTALASLVLFGAATLETDSTGQLAVWGVGFVIFGLALLPTLAAASPIDQYGRAFVRQGIVASLAGVAFGVAQWLRIVFRVAFD